MFSSVDDFNLKWLKIEPLIAFRGFQYEPRQTRFRTNHGVFTPACLHSMRCKIQGSSQGQRFFVPRSISGNGFCAINISRIFTRYRNEFEDTRSQALSHGFSMCKDFTQYTFQCQRKPILENLFGLRAVFDWHSKTPLCKGPFGDRFRCGGIRFRCNYNRPLFVCLSLGAFSYYQSGNQDAHSSGFTWKYPQFHSYYRRKNSRSKYSRSTYNRARSFLFDGQRLLGFRETL